VEAAAPQPSAQYLPGLDVVRGIAILMVLLDHGFAADQTPYLFHPSPFLLSFEYVARLGHLGVHLFFVLSGFLITGILLDTRVRPDYFRAFYTRRLLRIAPAYLLMLLVLLATHSITARYVAVCLLCLANMPSLLGATSEYPALWSLSVEEQFYLVWPLAVRKLSLRSLTILCTASLLLTPTLRFALLYGPAFVHDIRFKTWAVADFFAAGALLAIAARLPHLRPLLQKAVAPLLLSGVLLFVLQHISRQPINPVLFNLNQATYLEPWLLGFSGLVLLAFLYPDFSTSRAVQPLLFLAKISYGLYLIHPLLFDLVNARWPLQAPSTIGLFPQLLLRFLLEASIAIAIAALSRYTFEAFFLRLKPKHPGAARLRNAPEEIT
jgi:peptidoglycan/LPS O-acetylase OafA/YrhL